MATASVLLPGEGVIVPATGWMILVPSCRTSSTQTILILLERPLDSMVYVVIFREDSYASSE